MTQHEAMGKKARLNRHRLAKELRRVSIAMAFYCSPLLSAGEIDSAISNLAGNESQRRDAELQLASIDADQVISAVVTSLQSDARFSSGEARQAAYRVLLQSHAATSNSGLNQLIACLDEECCWSICASALPLTPASEKDRVAAAIDAFITTSNGNEDKERNMLRTVASLGMAKPNTIALAQTKFGDSKTDVRIRSIAANALLTASDPDSALLRFRNSDPDGIRAGLGAVGRYSLSHAKHEKGSEDVRDALLLFLTDMLNNENKEVRIAAINASRDFLMSEEGATDTSRSSERTASLLSRLTVRIESDEDPVCRDRALSVRNAVTSVGSE